MIRYVYAIVRRKLHCLFSSHRPIDYITWYDVHMMCSCGRTFHVYPYDGDC